VADIAVLRERMVATARSGTKLTYTDLYAGDRWAARGHASQDCGLISMDEHRAGRPLLSAVVVSKETGMASRGLYNLARQHDEGVLTGDNACPCGKPMLLPSEDEPAFRERQLRLVHAAWALASGPIGNPYVPAPAAPMPHRSAALVTNLDALDRATEAHRQILESLASFLRSKDLTPLEPRPDGPQFDLAWETAEATFVAEVKSLPADGERQQLRLGLGQVLDYQDALERMGKSTQAVLAVEREPRDLAWLGLCARHGVSLVWPGRFEILPRMPAPASGSSGSR